MTSEEDVNLDIEKYFNTFEWSEMSFFEKKRLKNILENYQKMKSFGFRPQEPAFVEEYNKRQEEEEKRATALTLTKNVNISEGVGTSSGSASKSVPNLKGGKDPLTHYIKLLKYTHYPLVYKVNAGPTTSAATTASKSAQNLKVGGKSPTSTKVVYNKGASTSSSAASISTKKCSRKSSSAVEVPSSLSVRLDIEKYFSFEEWRRKMEVERERLTAELETYSLNRTFGKNPEAPVFVVAYKERKIRDWQRDREKSSGGSSKNTKTKKSLKPSIDNANQVNSESSRFQDMSFYCAECNSVFTSPLYLEQHEMSCLRGIGAKRKQNVAEDICINQIGSAAICDVQSKKTPTAGERFKCDICDTLFTRKGNLIEHIEGVHNKLRSYICTDCGAHFFLKSKLTRHINGVHLKVLLYKCNMCNYKGSQSSHLQRHIQHVHMNLRAYKCNVCNNTFSQNSHLKRHIRLHTDKKLYQCQLCNKNFSLNRNLNAHKCTQKIN